MKKYILLLGMAALAFMSNAQQALWGGSQIVSPQVNDNNTVTFRLVAPNAREVKITGDFLPTQKIETPFGEFDGPGTADLIQKDGVWEFTTPEGSCPRIIQLHIPGRRPQDNRSLECSSDS